MTLLDNSMVPKWNEEPSTLDAFEERVILYVLETERGALSMRSKTFSTDGSRTTAVQGCQINCDDNTAGSIRWSDAGDCGSESMRKLTSHFEAFIKKTVKALHQADGEIDETTFLHPLIQGILLLECSNLSPAENAAVLATSGATTKGRRFHWKQLSVC